jgi:hypothetical protein
MPLAAITTACHLIRWFCTLPPPVRSFASSPPGETSLCYKVRTQTGFYSWDAEETLRARVSEVHRRTSRASFAVFCLWQCADQVREVIGAPAVDGEVVVYFDSDDLAAGAVEAALVVVTLECFGAASPPCAWAVRVLV